MAALSLYGRRCIKSWKLVEDPKFSKIPASNNMTLDSFFCATGSFLHLMWKAQLVCVLIRRRSSVCANKRI